VHPAKVLKEEIPHARAEDNRTAICTSPWWRSYHGIELREVLVECGSVVDAFGEAAAPRYRLNIQPVMCATFGSGFFWRLGFWQTDVTQIWRKDFRRDEGITRGKAGWSLKAGDAVPEMVYAPRTQAIGSSIDQLVLVRRGTLILENQVVDGFIAKRLAEGRFRCLHNCANLFCPWAHSARKSGP
jgi:hypothetical protein